MGGNSHGNLTKPNNRLKLLNAELTKNAASSRELCKILSTKLLDCGLSINWCVPASLNRGNLLEGAVYQLFHYGDLTPTRYFIHLKKDEKDIWRSTVSKTR